jgi:hypothetical protein
MKAADARLIVAELGVEDAIAALIAEALPLTDEQVKYLAALFAAPAREKSRQPSG